MAKRKQNLVLFFEENEEFNVINSRLVRMYMNQFTIAERDQTEVTAAYDIKSGTWAEYKECVSKSLRIERENETANTDTHFILGKETIIDFKTAASEWAKLIANHHSRLGNCRAFTLLSGSIDGIFLSGNHQAVADQYQNQDEFELKSFWWPLVHRLLGGENWVIEKFERRVNDDLEWFQSRILESGINSNVANESVKMFHKQMLDDNQVKDLKNSIAKCNKNLSFLKRLEKNNSKDTYVRFNCKRVTIYFKNEKKGKRCALSVRAAVLLSSIAMSLPMTIVFILKILEHFRRIFRSSEN